MKKTLLILSMFLLSAGLFSQSILTMWEFGPTSFSPSITTNGAPTDQEVVSHIKVQNAGTADVTIKVVRQELNVVPTTINQFCWGGICFSPTTDTSATSMTLAPGESTEEFSGHMQPNGIPGLSAIQYTFYEVGNPTNASTVIVMYNTMFSVSCVDGDSISPHMRKLDGNVDVPIHGIIKVHNYLPAPLNLVAFKQYVPVPVANSKDWMRFGGDEYAYGTDTTGVIEIPASTTDESFEMFYDADGNEGITQIVYVFQDPNPANAGNYDLYWIHFDAKITGISDEILANTTFSNAYPNPAESFVSFNYDIPNEVSTAQIIMTNLLGAVVYEGTLSGNNGTARIDVSNFTEGIYFATLKLENQITTTQKVLVQ
jgi:hypothetical protein